MEEPKARREVPRPLVVLTLPLAVQKLQETTLQVVLKELGLLLELSRPQEATDMDPPPLQARPLDHPTEARQVPQCLEHHQQLEILESTQPAKEEPQ